MSVTDDATPDPIWSRPDPAMVAAGVEGEFVVARVRLAAMVLLMIAPTWNVLRDPSLLMYQTGFIVTASNLVASCAIWLALQRGRWRPWIGFASSAFDVSMVTLALVSFLLAASPLVALKSTVTFEMYFLALLATSLRYDARICIVVGLLTIAEYGGLWVYASARHDLYDPALVAEAGPYLPVDQWTRLILLAIATLLAVAIVRRAQRLLYLAARDRLTGLYNRGHFDRTLATAMEQASRSGQPLALAILDVDHFKRINDVHGHNVGDRVLQQMAALLARSMRRTDTVARYGGEEFVILMPATTREAALLRMEALRLEVSAAEVEVDGAATVRIGFSAGIAGYPGDAMAVDAKSFVEVADRRLLAAKRAGRGRVLGEDIVMAAMT